MKKSKGITISIGQGKNRQIVSQAGSQIKIQGQNIKSTIQTVDLVFVIDTTGSMSDKIEGLLQTCAKFVDEFTALGLDYSIAIVAFGDLTVPGDKIVKTKFSNKVQVIRSSLKNIPRFDGGANLGESSLEAMQKAIELPFRSKAVKVIILITDEPALEHQIRANDMIGRLLQQEFLVFTISPALDYFIKMARSSGGKWYEISAHVDFTDLLEMFKGIAKNVTEVVSDVYKIGDGSVSNYLRLKPPK